jgi:hypothetical protein
MNAGGPIARPVTLSLATRDAVSRMAARRRNRGSVHAGWSKLTLRWRRRSPRPTRAAAGRKTIATHAYWVPQFHLHFTERAIQPQPQRISSDAPRLAYVRAPPLVVRHRHEAFIRARAVAPVGSRRLPRAAHGLAADQIRASRTQTSATEEPPQVSRSPMWLAMSLPHKRRSMRPSLERTPTLVHRRAAREQATLIESIRPTRWRESKGSRLSTLGRADMPSRGPSSRASHRPADLIWRTAPHTAAAVVDREAPPAAHVPPRPVPLTVRSTLRPADMPSRGEVARPSSRASHRPADLIWRTAPHTAAAVVDREAPPAAHVPDTSPVEAHKARPPVLSAANVDARLLDRLTDDVIRRVERRIRIERERSGL